MSLLLAGVLILGGCAQSVEEAPVDEVIEAPEASVPVEDVPRHPLTGFEVQEGSVIGPSIAVKIDNTSSGRPQVGIASADLVFEELVEGGVTRYLAVFHTAIPSEVGPVRSGRPQDADLVRALGGVFVFSGVGNANVREIIKASGLHLVEHDTSSGTPDGQYFFRSNRKPAPWNLHIEASDLIANYSDLEAPQTQFAFVSDVNETTAVQVGEVAESVRVVFSSGVDSIWQWDASSGVYLKFLSNGSPDTDADGTQISATNVVVLNPNYVDIEGLPSARIAGLIEDAYVASGGKYVRGTFDAMALGEPIKLLDGEGNPIRLAPGKTFVLLPPGPGSTASGVSAGSISFQ
jgi:hypothetical protein